MATAGRALRGAQTVFATLILLFGFAAVAQKVVLLRSSELAPLKAVEESFTASLGQPVKTLVLTKSSPEQVRAALAEGPSLVFAIGAEALEAAANKSAAPILYAMVPSTHKVPGAAKGIPMLVEPVPQLQAAKALLPEMKKVGVLFDPSRSGPLVEECEAAARAAGVTLVKAQVTARSEIAGATRALMDQVDLLWLLPDPTVVSGETFKFLVQTSLSMKVPLLGFSGAIAKAGALVSTDVELPQMGKAAAQAARRVIGGGALQVEPPAPGIVINGKTAELLGVSIPKALLERGARVIE